ncbi:hypothetical protein PVAP13_9NG574700 [Panicum virgatum]|uniref:Uncharacterized protein n=1 Tax=Panicum virgatum TaxID=38727 RepID=A0A8T0MSX9_PANVG|nr:hypothetical protein PVAP13_9NG574700 [Panicum virgatum]
MGSGDCSSPTAYCPCRGMILLITIRRRWKPKRRYNLPPVPRPWPVIGNLNLMGKLPHRSVQALSKRYGPLMSLRFGSFPVIVGSSVDAARSILKTHDLAFCDCPRIAAGRYTGYTYSDVLWAPYGAYWRQARRLFKTEILSARRLRSHERVRDEEVRAMLRDVYQHGPAAGRAVGVLDHLLMVNSISRMVLGKKYVVHDGTGAGGGGAGSATTPEEFMWMVDELVLLPQRRAQRRGHDPVARLAGPEDQEDQVAGRDARSVPRASPGRARPAAAAGGRRVCCHGHG